MYATLVDSPCEARTRCSSRALFAHSRESLTSEPHVRCAPSCGRIRRPDRTASGVEAPPAGCEGQVDGLTAARKRSIDAADTFL